MAGSWEIARQREVLVAILHTEVVSTKWADSFKNLIVPGAWKFIAGQPFDMARNTACQLALANGFRNLFFLDSDVCCPPDTILRLLAHRQPIMSGVYHRRSPPHGVAVMLKNGQWIADYPANTVIEVDVVGTGCLLLSRQLLETIPPLDPRRGKHWFDWRVDAQQTGTFPPGECMSEDFTACVHWRKHGYKVLVDTGIQCDHVGLAVAKKGVMEPACV